MSLVASLLQAIVHVDGEALVIHAGDKPYVVASTGQVELASRGLTLDAVSGIVDQLLPAEFQSALDEFGAVQYELPPRTDFPNEHFTVVAARGGDDVWAEIRRRRIPDEDHVPEEIFAAPPVSAATPEDSFADEDSVDLSDFTGGPRPPGPVVVPKAQPPAAARVEDRPQPPAPARVEEAPRHAVAPPHAAPAPARPAAPPPPPPAAAAVTAPPAVPPQSPAPPAMEVGPEAQPVASSNTRPVVGPPAPPREPPLVAASAPEPAAPERVAPIQPVPPAEPIAPSPEPQPVTARQPAAAVPPVAAPQPVATPQLVQPLPVAPPQPAVVLPIARNPIRNDPAPVPSSVDTLSGLARLLRVAAARGASTLYLSSGERPTVRVDGEIQTVDGEPVLSSHDVISLLLTLMPDRSHEALRTGAPTEWISEIEDVGRVRCVSFSDQRGPGGVFRLMPAKVASIEQLGVSREIQALANEPEGLMLVVGLRSSGKRTLLSAFVEYINRTRRDHLITIEREVSVVHPRGHSFISQREVRGGDAELLEAARSALREDPDVLVLEQIRTGSMMDVAIEAASSGHLVVGGFSAHNATAAIDRIIDLYPPEQARRVQLALADNLRGVIAQVLLKRTGGGRVAAREVLLNTPSVAGVIAEGKTSQLPMAIEGGRRHGMMPLNEAVAALVENGTVDPSEAYRHVSDRTAFVSLLKRHGVDTSFAERLA